jgi:anti-sigma factor ChrR (cupin superfamily)
MRMRNVLAFAVSLAVATAVLAQAPGEKKMKSAPKAAGSGAVFIPAADLKWVDLDPTGAPGVKVADAWGDHTKGAFGAFTKFPAGWSTPVHTHTHAYKIVVLSGTWIHTPEGKPEVRLGPGSYMLQPGGSYKHTSACDKASECVIFNVSDGKFDLIVAEGSKAPEKKKM